MTFRKLRIAWAVFWAVACVLMIVLWMRSYWVGDIVHLPSHPGLLMTSVVGDLQVTFKSDARTGWKENWKWISNPADNWFAFNRDWKHWAYSRDKSDFSFRFPIWLACTVFATLSLIAWLPSHFSLRTLLIATTLVAVVFGAIVYAER
jgi:hypothetical protein